MHASASPFEGLAERTNWLKGSIADDPFGKALLDGGRAGGDHQEVVERSAGQVRRGDGQGDGQAKGSIFDALEDLDYEEAHKTQNSMALTLNTRPAIKIEGAQHTTVLLHRSHPNSHYTCCSLPLNILFTAPAIGVSSTLAVAVAALGVESVACIAAWKTASSASKNELRRPGRPSRAA